MRTNGAHLIAYLFSWLSFKLYTILSTMFYQCSTVGVKSTKPDKCEASS